MDRIGYYFIVPLLLAIVYLGGTISGRSRHSRTLYQWMSGFFLLLTAVYLAPMGVVSVWLSLAALVGALAVGLLLRRAIGSERLLPGKELMRSQYPVLFYLLPIVLGSLIGMGRTSRPALTHSPAHDPNHCADALRHRGADPLPPPQGAPPR